MRVIAETDIAAPRRALWRFLADLPAPIVRRRFARSLDALEQRVEAGAQTASRPVRRERRGAAVRGWRKAGRA